MNWRRALIGMLVAVPVLALLGYGMTVDPRMIPSPLPGREAPDFELAVISVPGRGAELPATPDTVRLKDLRGQVVVMNFWASWCLACRDEHAALSETAARYGNRGVRVLGVLYNDSPERGRHWIRQMGGQTYESVADSRSRTAIEYGLYGVPETFLIAPDGRVAYKHVGPVTATLLSTMIDSLLAAHGPGGDSE